MILSTKKIIILGALGNIGGFLSKYLLGGRLHDQNLKLVEVDLKFKDSQFRYLHEIPEDDFLNLDFFIGVIGESILKKDLIEKILLNGKSEKLFFASGSTKTVEFSDLSEYLYNLSILEKPNIQGNEVSIQFHKIFDPQTLMIQGTKVTIQFLFKSIVKTLYLLGDLSPINFLYYGVPTEMMDKILSQLIQLSLGLTHQYKNKNLPVAGIYAVDKEINEFGEIL